MKKILAILWQLPQMIVGLVVLLVNFKSVKKITDSVKPYYQVKRLGNSGLTCGELLIIDSDKKITDDLILHEYGHQIQSRRLGWLYLIIIGIPSAIGNIVYRYKKYKYYQTPWEHNASVLGGSKLL